MDANFKFKVKNILFKKFWIYFNPFIDMGRILYSNDSSWSLSMQSEPTFIKVERVTQPLTNVLLPLTFYLYDSSWS